MAFTNRSDPSDLSDLFQHSLRLQHNPSTPAAQFHFPSPTSHIYASQHYTHPSYQGAPTTSSSGPSRGYDEDTLATIFRRHEINPALLSQAQISLFEMAGHDEQLRLLELWRTAPMTPADLATQFGPTSVGREESAARERYERCQQAQRARERSDSFDFGEGKGDVEPYMCAGYGQGTGERYREPVFGRSGTADESRNRYESGRQAGGFETDQRLMHGSTDGAAEYDDGMEL